MQPFTGVSRTRFGGRDNGTFQEKAEAVSAARDHIQLFRQRLSHKSVKAYATMPISNIGRKSSALID